MRSACFLFFVFLTAAFPVGLYAQKTQKPKILAQVAAETSRDAEIEKAVISVVSPDEPDDKDTRYYYNLVDLNGDGADEVLVYIFGEGRCGTGGCSVLLFHKVEGIYELITKFRPARNPVVVSQKSTGGWKDLIFQNVGGGITNGYYSVCKFDGESYPSNPTVDEAATLKTGVKGTEYLVGPGYGESGLAFRDLQPMQ